MEQPAENIKEPAMIHVCLHLSEQQKCRHRPMMCLSLQKTWNSLQRMSMSLQWSLCVCIYQSNRSADIDQWCVWVCRKHGTACRECQWACNDPCVSASIIATQLQTWTNDVFESAENTDQPAQNIKEPAMIHVWLHLSEQENWRHQPMMCWQRTNSFRHKY